MSSSRRALEFRRADRIERNVSYLARCRYAVWLRNNTDTAVHLRSLSVRTQGEDASVRDTPMLLTTAAELDLRIEPGAWERADVVLVPPLIAFPGTAYLSVCAEYEPVTDYGFGPSRTEAQDNFDCLVLHPAPGHPDARVFVSFVDPEDGPLADLAALYLRRAGVEPYLAKDDTRTGCEYWADKIFPAIERAAGVLVIWTAETLRRPESVIREIEHAQRVGTPVGLFRAQLTELPSQYPREVKEYAEIDVHAPRPVFARAIAAGAETWRSTGGRFFK